MRALLRPPPCSDLLVPDPQLPPASAEAGGWGAMLKSRMPSAVRPQPPAEVDEKGRFQGGCHPPLGRSPQRRDERRRGGWLRWKAVLRHGAFSTTEGGRREGAAAALYQEAFLTPGNRPFDAKSLIIIRDILKNLWIPRDRPVKTHLFRTRTLEGLAPSLDNCENAASRLGSGKCKLCNIVFKVSRLRSKCRATCRRFKSF